MTAPKEYDFDPHNLPQKTLAAIGLATASWAQTEELFEWAIAGCLGVDTEYGAATTTHMATPLRLSVLRSVAEIKIDSLDVLDALDALIERAEAAAGLRNSIVHQEWCRDLETKEVFIVKETSRASYSLDLVPMPVDKIEAHAEIIYQIGMDLMAFLKANNLLPKHAPVRPRFHKTKTERKKRRDALLRPKGSKPVRS